MKIKDLWRPTWCIFENYLSYNESSLVIRIAVNDNEGRRITEAEFMIRTLDKILWVENAKQSLFILTVPTRNYQKQRLRESGMLRIKLMIEKTIGICSIAEDVEVERLKLGAKHKDAAEDNETDECNDNTERYIGHKTRIVMTRQDAEEFVKVLRGISELGEKARKAVEGNKKRGRKAKGGEK
jgi:hypothetical protein